MTNVLNGYIPTFFAQEGLIILENALGLAGRTHRGYEEERRVYGLGDTIRCRRPGSFVVTDAGAGTVQAVQTTHVDVKLEHHKEVMFEVTDKELVYASKRVIEDHVEPAIYEIADWVDGQLAGQYVKIPWFADAAGTSAIADIAKGRRVLRDNKVPLGDPSRLHMMVNGQMEESFLASSAFTQQQGAGDAGVTAQRTGQIGQKLGFNIFANQNTKTHATTAISLTGNLTVGNASKGATQLTLTGGASTTGTITAGDTFSFVGSTQRYAATANATFSGNSATVSISPPLKADVSGSPVATLRQQNNKVENLMFHRNAIALAVAPLPDFMETNASAMVATATTPDRSLSLRAARWWDPKLKKHLVSFDILLGFEVLDPNLAVRVNATAA